MLHPNVMGTCPDRVDPATAYLPSMSLGEYLRDIAAQHPALSSVLDFSRPDATAALTVVAATVTEFDSDDTGRGDSYRRAQTDASVRLTGIRQLLRLALPAPAPASMVLDVLGGDGTVARAVADRTEDDLSMVTVVTGDISGEMVQRALAQGQPAVRQAADFLFLRNDSVDAVVLAYGTHHIAVRQRAAAVAEAFRVVRPGGRVVLHDFAEDSPMVNFFAQVVHPNSCAGHDYPHFSLEHLNDLFRQAGAYPRVINMYDPLKVVADTLDAARRKMCDYVGDMYGIRHLFDDRDGSDAPWRILERYFDHSNYPARLPNNVDTTLRPRIYQTGNQFVAEVPRVAMVAVAQKPA
jgi:ubiquinone/menaquinone biosynthesis C-methylase UbiE